MVYGANTVLPTNLQYGSPRVRAYQPDAAKEARKGTIDLLEESRDIVVIRSTGYQQALRWYHTRRVHPRAFQIGNLVLRWIRTKKGKNKLSPPCVGPYLVAEVLRPRAYQLQEIDNVTFPNV
jgi:hypothetical protein